MPEFIDLRSDTVTRPNSAMREAIAHAEVGDDMVGEDPTVNRLEEYVAELLGKDAALFCCSGTQSNQLGLWAHCRSADEVLIHRDGHIANYEAGAPAVLHGVTCRMLDGPGGMIDVPELNAALRPADQHFCRTRLVCLENTTNKGGGRVWSADQIARVADWAHAHGLATHMDGARLFNACVAGNYSPADATRGMDTVSICFSKGLGCPMGSVLVGNRDAVDMARRGRKIVGGALRQAGMMAAAAQYALENHVDRLADDHANAKTFAEAIADIPGLHIDVDSVETNLVFFEVDPDRGTGAQLEQALAARGVKMYALGPQRLRACTHLDVSRDDLLRAAEVVRECLQAGFADDASVTSSPYAQR